MKDRKFENFSSNVICLTETWKEAKKYYKQVLNSPPIANNRLLVAEISCIGSGRHQTAEKDLF